MRANAALVKSNIRETEEEIQALETVQEELTTIRDAIYSSGERDLLPLAQQMTDGTPFRLDLSKSPLRDRMAYVNALARALTPEQSKFVTRWRASQISIDPSGAPLSLHGIDARLHALRSQLAGMSQSLPTEDETAAKSQEVAALVAEFESNSTEFYSFYDTLEETLSALDEKMAAATQARTRARHLSQQIKALSDQYDIAVDRKFKSDSPPDIRLGKSIDGQQRERSLRERLNRFVRMVHSGNPEAV